MKENVVSGGLVPFLFLVFFSSLGCVHPPVNKKISTSYHPVDNISFSFYETNYGIDLKSLQVKNNSGKRVDIYDAILKVLQWRDDCNWNGVSDLEFSSAEMFLGYDTYPYYIISLVSKSDDNHFFSEVLYVGITSNGKVGVPVAQ